MSEPTETTLAPIPEINAPVAVAAAIPIIVNSVTVNVQAPPSPRAKSHKDPVHHAHSAPPIAKPHSVTSIPKMAAVATSGPVDRGVTHHEDFDRGRERHTLTDRDGSTVMVVRSAESSDYSVTFDDKAARFTTHSDEPGFAGTRRVPYGYGGIKSFAMKASAAGTFTDATLYCQDNIAPLSFAGIIPVLDGDTITTSNKMIDTTTVQEVKAFLKRNPELAVELGKMNVPVTEVAGESQTIGDLKRFDPKIQACPSGKDNDYVRSVRGK